MRLRIRKTRPCRDLRLAAVKSDRPLLEPAYTTLYYQADQVFEYLIEGSVSYGVANQLAGESLAAFERRSNDYSKAGSDYARRARAAQWLDTLQRAHSDPPPSAEYRDKCHWREINIACE